MQSWATLSKRTILDRGKFLAVEEHEVKLPDGTVISDWAWVITPEYVNILPVTEDGDFICLKQVKFAINELSLATVGGYVESGEDSLLAAQRELREETGYEADDWTNLGSYIADANRGGGKAHLFLARGARQVCAPDPDDLGEQDVVHLSYADIKSALLRGEFRVLGWTTLVALSLQHIDMKDPPD